jgi:hypothetical protein
MRRKCASISARGVCSHGRQPRRSATESSGADLYRHIANSPRIVSLRRTLGGQRKPRFTSEAKIAARRGAYCQAESPSHKGSLPPLAKIRAPWPHSSVRVAAGRDRPAWSVQGQTCAAMAGQRWKHEARRADLGARSEQAQTRSVGNRCAQQGANRHRWLGHPVCLCFCQTSRRRSSRGQTTARDPGTSRRIGSLSTSHLRQPRRATRPPANRVMRSPWGGSLRSRAAMPRVQPLHNGAVWPLDAEIVKGELRSNGGTLLPEG